MSTTTMNAVELDAIVAELICNLGAIDKLPALTRDRACSLIRRGLVVRTRWGYRLNATCNSGT